MGAERKRAQELNLARVARYNATRAEQGLVKVCVWVPAEHKDEIKLIAKGFRS